MTSTSRRKHALAWLCALCLLGFQAAGHWHRIAHAGGLSGHSSAADIGWGHHSGDAECHLFDQLGQGDGPTARERPLCGPQSHVVPTSASCTLADLAACWKRGARGPPVSV